MTTKKQMVNYIRAGILTAGLGMYSGIALIVTSSMITPMPEMPKKVAQVCSLEWELQRTTTITKVLEDMDKYQNILQEYNNLKKDTEFVSLDKEYEKKVSERERVRIPVVIGGGLLALISLVGGFGLAAYSTNMRKK